jgi:hypothetical protein
MIGQMRSAGRGSWLELCQGLQPLTRKSGYDTIDPIGMCSHSNGFKPNVVRGQITRHLLGREESPAVSKISNRIFLIIGLLGVSLFTGCGVTSTSLPSSLTPGGGAYLTINTTQVPDAIAGRTYFLVMSTTGGSGIVGSCGLVSGSLPAGSSCLSGTAWNAANPSNTVGVNDFVVSGTVPTTAAGTYPVTLQA